MKHFIEETRPFIDKALETGGMKSTQPFTGAFTVRVSR